jgi:hypothetical protein
VLTITADDDEEIEYCDKGGTSINNANNSPFNVTTLEDEYVDEGPQVDPFSTNEEQEEFSDKNVNNVPEVLTNPFVMEGETQVHVVNGLKTHQEDEQQNNQNLFFDEGVDQNRFVGFFEEQGRTLQSNNLNIF